MKKTSKKQLVLRRDTLKALTVLSSTAYRHVVGGVGAPKPNGPPIDDRYQHQSEPGFSG